ncbi:hypothetical protein BOTBODRAFT_412516 [Botryobasidium botryosum FD-172 SS1]|uniref:Uncharacterized protein n=1 Tax=Botryobasidium botryosum (strain FD-172 SS1) TaxID=930990 RepID=A0A067M9X4_BOTB1|nr:hypothetical protein BOTBODRAFT_412516 [Botryobasidium botryosum FD-172 SS1]
MFEEPRYEAGTPPPHVRSAKRTNHYTSFPHLLVCDAILSLHFKRARAGNATSLGTCLDASRKAMPVVQQILRQDMCDSAFAYSAVAWAHMFRVFATEYQRLVALGDDEKAQLVIPELKVLSKALGQRTAASERTRTIIAGLKAAFPTLQHEYGMF